LIARPKGRSFRPDWRKIEAKVRQSGENLGEATNLFLLATEFGGAYVSSWVRGAEMAAPAGEVSTVFSTQGGLF